MTFAYPFAFWLLALIPLLWFKWRQERATLAVPDVASLNVRKARIGPEAILRLLRSAALVAAIVALARPQNVMTVQLDEHSGVDIMLGVDISRSMAERDFRWQNRHVDRLTMVKIVLDQFVSKRPKDRIGLVVFGSEAFLQSPLTLDHGVTRFLVDDLQIGQAGPSTALGDALGVAIKRMKDLPAKSKIIVLLTDGRDTASKVTPKSMAAIAKQQGIKVYTIAMGSKRLSQSMGDQSMGDQSILDMLNTSDSAIDVATLKGISAMTGGTFFMAEDSQKLMEIYDEIDRAEKRQDKVVSYTDIEELYYPYALAALLLFALEVTLSATVLRIIPE